MNRTAPVLFLLASVLSGLFGARALEAQSPPKVIFLGSAIGADADIQTFLEGRYGKANVTFLNTDPNGITASQILGYDVAVLSSTPSSSRYRSILDLSPTPIVNLEEAVADNTPAGEFSITTDRIKETEAGPHTIKITGAHPITAGFPVNSTVTITTASTEVWWSGGLQAPGAVSLAEDDDTATNLFLTYVDEGGTLLNGNKATCRRVMLGLTDFSFTNFSADGKKLFGQAVDWAALGCCAQSSNFGTGLAGQNGIPTLSASAAPVFNASINILVGNSSGTANSGLVIVGQQKVNVPFLGGTLLVVPLLELYVTIPANGLSLPVTVPDLTVLCGINPDALKWAMQSMQLDGSAAAGVAISPGLNLRLGK